MYHQTTEQLFPQAERLLISWMALHHKKKKKMMKGIKNNHNNYREIARVFTDGPVCLCRLHRGISLI